MQVLFVLFVLIMHTGPAAAHALQPGYLEITQMSDAGFRIVWKKPDVAGRPMSIHVRLPAACDMASPPPPSYDGRVWSSIWLTTCAGGLDGQPVVIEGLETTRTDVLVRYRPASGPVRSERLTPQKTGFVIPANPSALSVLRSYIPLGVEHILGGIDHLLFVFALLLIIRDRWRLLFAITAFTVAHSITMAAATLKWVSLPGPPVEAVIALSIMFLASEILQQKRDQERLSERYPWAVSFSFGLLHGFGFAGALADIGLPQTDIPLALLAFNTGVELGQLIFVAAVLCVAMLLRCVWPAMVCRARAPNSAFLVGSAYFIGALSAFWFIERVTGFFA
ncbi:HupE/UreJ family protein [Roseobacter ponti]|uniref:HupE/UreJ family protein n=1 Tax=Roseobacter ponti TaxID=1891787 RepID=A0A858SQK6_9RHOB|nr:HupE/UreJ family protein [Roseobacter ponti]QJF50287.1 HupE/UreJ family protein [Roseobacter ponti]